MNDLNIMPKVSVFMLAYNHEPFIAQALDSVLMQQTDFAYEVVIGEDCSTDGTREIVKTYQAKYPECIQPIFYPHNVGMLTNFVTTLHACRGQYIAWLEGDDYWTCASKLQIQVEFLDSHPECALYCHNAVVIYDDDSRDPHYHKSLGGNKTLSLEDILMANPIPNASMMFRNGLVNEFPDWFYTLKMADWPLVIMLCQHGTVEYLNEVMSAYRIHDGGVWSSLNDSQRFQAKLDLYALLNRLLDFRYDRLIRIIRSQLLYSLAQFYKTQGDSAQAKVYAAEYIRECPVDKLLFDSRPVKLLLGLYCSGFYQLLKLACKKRKYQSLIPFDHTDHNRHYRK